MRPSIARFTAALALASLATTFAPPASAQGAPPPADPAKLEEAKRHMQAGAAFYNDPSGHKCEEAIREFGKAYDLSGSLNALKGMAVCNLELERDGEAIEQYTKYLQGKGASIDPADKQQIESDLNALRSAAAYITFSAPLGNWKLTDTRTPSRGFPITNRYQIGASTKKLGIHPGQHTFTASAEGKPDIVWQAEIVNGAKYDHTFEFDKGAAPPPPVGPTGPTGPKGVVTPPPKDLPPPPDTTRTTRPIPTSAYVVGGITIAALGATVGLGARALGKESDYKSKNGTASSAELQTLHDDVKSANLITDVLLGVTVAGAVTTTVLIITRPSRPAKEPRTGTWTLAPTAGPTGGGALLTGTF